MEMSGGAGSSGKRQYSLVVNVPTHGRLGAAAGEEAPATPTKSPRKELGSGAMEDDSQDIVTHGGGDHGNDVNARQVMSPRNESGEDIDTRDGNRNVDQSTARQLPLSLSLSLSLYM